MAVKDDLPKSDVNKEYYLQNIDKQVSHTHTLTHTRPHTLTPPTPADCLGAYGAWRSRGKGAGPQ